MTKAIGIVDEANKGENEDKLGIEIHSESLIEFINDTNTPITVGIQGEWGSGKTSLINKIHHHFDQPDQERIKQIWINSWEYSLLSTPEEALLKIVNRIIDELVDADPNKARVDKIKSGAKTIFQGALRVGASVAAGSEAAKVAGELMNSAGQSISELRKQLSSVVNEMADRSSNPYEKVIIYVDDLDRIEPRNAVAILELLKNIFSVPKCVFILAIDYQVVVKGLEHKFGKQTPENEWEFRAFFDKIIQLPFMMPMGQYDIGKYVNSLLLEIGFVEGEGLDDDSVREIILRTIGGNPRSIKRLVNSVSLIQIFAIKRKAQSEKEDLGDEDTQISDADEKFLLFSLLCLQIAYPPIYSLLVEAPDFAKWDDDFALKQTNRSEERVGDIQNLSPEAMKNIFENEFKAAMQSEDFNEDWEKALYRICYGRPRLKPRVSDISKFFSYIKDDLIGEMQENIIGEVIARIMTQTSVTSVTSTDQGQVGAMTSRSKRHDAADINLLQEYSSRMFAALKASGSIVLGDYSQTDNITGSSRRRIKGLFRNPDLNPRWEIRFTQALIVDFGRGLSAETNLELIQYFEQNIQELKSALPGKWEVSWKEGVKNKPVGLYGPLYDKKNFRGSSNLKECDDATRDQTITWVSENLPKFERLIIQMADEFFEKSHHGE
jgi:hypothetical protein